MEMVRSPFSKITSFSAFCPLWVHPVAFNLLALLIDHVTTLGIKLKAVGDNVELFGLALTVFSLILLYLHRREIPLVGARLFPLSTPLMQ
jgi:hypothetical protein